MLLKSHFFTLPPPKKKTLLYDLGEGVAQVFNFGFSTKKFFCGLIFGISTPCKTLQTPKQVFAGTKIDFKIFKKRLFQRFLAKFLDFLRNISILRDFTNFTQFSGILKIFKKSAIQKIVKNTIYSKLLKTKSKYSYCTLQSLDQHSALLAFRFL